MFGKDAYSPMSDELEEHMSNVSIGGMIFIDYRFADEIVLNAEEEEEAGDIVISMDTTCIRYKIDTGPDKTRSMRLSKSDKDKRPKARRGEEFQISSNSHLKRSIHIGTTFKDRQGKSCSL